ncbi:MAG: UDP-3-O-(3-hydroxymyristoyl)glucosamine N-acyltransferase, partial [Candidatus Marinimicrobia bacterium]|nr:UDP-3-O-(3-hydroxymyristoyl)glucosamine N-acyltransferase [Candidatus Neomarinimicrobiota bacterium]
MSTLKELAVLVGGELIGDPRLEISGVSEIQNGKPGTITFLANPRYKKYLNDTKAAAVFTYDRNLLKKQAGIVVDNPQMALAIILKYFQSAVPLAVGIHPTTIVDPTAEIGENVGIGPYSIIETGAQIGSNTTIGAHTVIGYNTEIGTNVQLYPRVVIYH